MSKKPKKTKQNGDRAQEREIVRYSEEYYFQGTIPHPSLVEKYEQVGNSKKNKSDNSDS